VLELLLMVAVLLLAAAVWLQLRQRRTLRKQESKAKPADTDRPVQPAPAGPGIRVEGTKRGHLAVLTSDQLLQVTGAWQLLEHLDRRACLARPVFERDLLPAVQRFAEFVQLMPASESHHHANVGGLLAHALETTYHALVLRAGYLLPRNGGAEMVDAQRDYWTYAVFIGALLHDVGKPMTDLRIDMHRATASEPTRWLPMAGSLNECLADQYTVKFAPKAERDYGAHSRLGTALMMRLVPASALSFLGRCPDVLQELTQYLAGEGRQGAIAEIVTKADQLSTKHNLEGGSRARFASARSVPLIEQLMGAMQEMLRHDGELPLNRDGAAGWVYDGSAWFVAKRLADAVREHIVARAGDEAGVPGEAKNDRLFDCWQEYGQVMPNPETKQAIWHVIVHGEDADGYSHTLSVLRFPLEKLWPEGPSAFPPAMAGRIEVLSKRKTAGNAGDSEDAPEAAQPTVPSVATSLGVPVIAGERGAIRAPRFAQGPGKSTPRRSTVTIPDEADDDARDDKTASDPHRDQLSALPQSANATDVVHGATPVHRGAASAASRGAREPSEAANAFMRWVQRGLADGSLKYNEAGAPVHFVDAGMALVSPAIFRDFALQFGEPSPSARGASRGGPERVGLSIQREVLRAGWHAPNPKDGTNIWTFLVSSRRGSARTSRLSAVVLADVRRWVIEPPPSNPALQLDAADRDGSDGELTEPAQ
jgi:integrating conjugative element relaxase (TIGR03760 family)